MGKALNVEFKLSKGKKSENTFFTSSVNEDLEGVGAGQKGTLAILLSISGEGDFEERARSLVKKFEDEYLKPREGTVLTCLEAALRSMQEETKDENFLLEITTAVVWGLVLYVGKLGETQIFLSRDKVSKPIKFKFVASGMLNDADTLALVNSAFAKAVSEEELSLILGRDSLEEVKLKLDQTQESSPGSACLLLRMKLEEVGVEEVPITFLDSDKKTFSTSLAVKEKLDLVVRFSTVVFGKVKATASPIWERIKPFFAQVARKLYEPWRRKQPGEIFNEKARQKLRLLEVGTVLALILIFSLGLSFLRSRNQEKTEQFQALVNQVKEKITQAKESLVVDPSLGQIQISQGRDLLSQAEKLSSTAETESLEKQLNSLEKESQRVYSPSALKEVTDLSSLGFTSSQIVLADDFLIALDTGKSLLAKFKLSTSKRFSVATAGRKFKNLASLDGDLYLLTAGQVFDYNPSDNSSNQVLRGESFGSEIVDGAIYSSNLYLLDKEKKQVWKYLKFGAGLTSARSYFTSTPPDLTKATGLAIDGSVWIGTSEGSVYKFLTGKRQDFELFGAPEDLSISKIVTNEKTKNLYLLDASKGRVVIFDKAGDYLASYESEKIKDAASLVVSEKQKTIYFSRQAKIFSFRIK
ncbi:MAG: hypothetical protein Q8P13_00540 [bacterium]|nr:hypothetical protein [bacterium]